MNIKDIRMRQPTKQHNYLKESTGSEEEWMIMEGGVEFIYFYIFYGL